MSPHTGSITKRSSRFRAAYSLSVPDLRVIRTKAIPSKPVRLVGDIGLRALYWHFKALDELVARKEIDFIHFTIPSNYLGVAWANACTVATVFPSA